MRFESNSGAIYWARLPHYREAGAVYHVRFSVHPRFRSLNSPSEYACLQNAIVFAHKRTHIVIAYVVMPNHVHVVMQPLPRVGGWDAWCKNEMFYKLEDILRDIKKFSALEINRSVGRHGPVWLTESFDRIARGGNDLWSVIDYVHGNPVRWGLVQQPEKYPWSSASTIYSGRIEYRDWFTIAPSNK